MVHWCAINVTGNLKICLIYSNLDFDRNKLLLVNILLITNK